MKRIPTLAMRYALLTAAVCSGCSAATSSSPDMVATDFGVPLVAPELLAVTPAIASNAGGTPLIIAGANFASGATVTVNGVLAAPARPSTPTSLVVTLPAQPGVVDQVPVVVTNRDGKSVSRSDLFAYSAALSTTLAVGTGPSSVVVGDFDADGNADIAVANHDSVNISVLFGNGKGGFKAPQYLIVGLGPLVLATADFNGDGVDDLAVYGAPTLQTIPDTTSLDIVLGARTGKLALVSPGLANQVAMCLVAGDWNGDGKADLASVGESLLGDGTGRLGPPIGIDVFGGLPFWMAPGDVNGDGKLDLLLNDIDLFRIYLGDGTGKFNKASTGYYLGGYSSSAAVLKDINGDGHADVVANNSGHRGESGNLGVLLSDGMGGFGAHTFIFRTNHQRSDGVVVADFDGDGKPDVAVTNYYEATISILPGDGRGGFGSETNFPVGRQPIALAAGDFNGDGRPDLVVANEADDSVTVLLNPFR